MRILIDKTRATCLHPEITTHLVQTRTLYLSQQPSSQNLSTHLFRLPTPSLKHLLYLFLPLIPSSPPLALRISSIRSRTPHFPPTQTMPPPTALFPATALPQQIQVSETSHVRKPPLDRKVAKGSPNIRLEECELLEMVQYTCGVEEPKKAGSLVTCWEVERLFRR